MNRLLLLAALVAALTACSSGPDLKSDWDRSADFGGYRTYGFVEESTADERGYSTLITKYMREAVAAELESRGYVPSDDPDLRADFWLETRERTEVRQQSGVGVGTRGRGYSVWGTYPVYEDTYTWTEGTLVIGLVDARASQLVWEGRGVGRVRDKSLEDPEPAVKEAVTEVFTRYPFRAGSGVPESDG